MFDLFYISNNVDEIKIVDKLDIDWVFIDLEFEGKAERQIGRNTVISKHSIDDILKIRDSIVNTKILVRCNPIGLWSTNEINILNNIDGIDMVMLPYFKSTDEVKVFLNLLDTNRIKPTLLVETLDAVQNIQEILNLFKFEYIHIGLNDIHIERQTKSMFEPYIDGFFEDLIPILNARNQRFGIGGIGKIGSSLIPSPECVVNEHIRLNSSGVILSRSFKGNFNSDDLLSFEKNLMKSIKNLRNYIFKANKSDERFLNESYSTMKKDILNMIKNN